MLNKYQTNLREFERISRIIASGPMRVDEIYRLFRNYDSGKFLVAMGGYSDYKTNERIAHEIHMIFAEGLNPDQPYVPPVHAPTPELPDGLETLDPVCDGCGGFSVPTGKRWGIVEQGKPITVSINMKGAPRISGYDLRAIKEEFEFWSRLSDGVIQFKYMTGQRRGMIHMVHDRIDGPGKVLGATWQSTSDEMAEGGIESGDFTIDNTERWFRMGLPRLLMVIRHEIGHALGFPHTDNPEDIMFDSPTMLNLRGAGPGDIAVVGSTYPKPAGAKS